MNQVEWYNKVIGAALEILKPVVLIYVTSLILWYLRSLTWLKGMLVREPLRIIKTRLIDIQYSHEDFLKSTIKHPKPGRYRVRFDRIETIN